jgi:sugar O-acyltransferase (sialic acid O-acetyltransferase NeuD family)
MPQEKKNIVIFGASGHAKVIIDSIEKCELYNIVGLIDSYKDIKYSIFEYSILGTENEIVALSKEYNFSAGIIAIGDNWTRKLIHEKIIRYLPEFEFINAIHPSAILGKNVEIGIGNAIMAGVIINSDSKVGNFCILNTNASLGHDGTLGDYSSLASRTTLGGTVSVGTCTAISLGANVLQAVHIGDYAIIGAGSLINKDVEDFTLVYGVPGKKIRTIQEGEKYLQKNTTKIIEENLKTIAVPALDDVIKHREINVKELEIVGYELACFDLKTATDIEIYKENLRNFKGYDAFYKIEQFSIKNTEKEHLKYFVLIKEEEVLVLMPFALRKITIRDKNTTYNNVSSFYGYSGPLFNDKITDKDLDCFWYLADSWYQKNKVISEFMCFNLEGNYNNYSGVLYPTLNNIIGDIAKDEEEQWISFPSKVRNNYRKAITNGLEAKIFHKNINETYCHLS